MPKKLVRISIGLMLLGIATGSAQALKVNSQNQLIAQAGEKVTVTYVSVASAHRGEVCNIFTPSTQATIDTQSTGVGKTVDLGAFKATTEIILQLVNPATGFTFFNDSRNNIDLENHLKFTDLGQGKFMAGWQVNAGEEKYSDLVILIQATPATQTSMPQRNAAASWRHYE